MLFPSISLNFMFFFHRHPDGNVITADEEIEKILNSSSYSLHVFT